MNRTVASGSSGGFFVDYSAGVNPGTLITAADMNMHQEEIANSVESMGWALDATDKFQLRRTIIGQRKSIGELVESEIKLTAVTVAQSRSTTNPAFPDYLPIIPRTADIDVPSTQAPDLVTAYRAFAADVLGVASFTATVAGSVLTFASTTTNNQLLAALAADALVSRWLSSGESATYQGSGGDFSNGRCINVAGTDFAITAISIGSRTITVSGTPSSGSQTVIFYPYRIAGSSTSVRLHKLSGFVPAASNDATGYLIGGLRKMDTEHGHTHNILVNNSLSGNVATPLGNFLANITNGYRSASDNVTPWVDPALASDGTNGTPRADKNTSPRSHARYFYTWVGRLLT
jgi:hypothetical protein